jgi:DNA-binding NarL/FixJ family response regulator
MDLQMPGVDGVSATREIVGAELADVLVLTSYSTPNASSERSTPGPWGTCWRTPSRTGC